MNKGHLQNTRNPSSLGQSYYILNLIIGSFLQKLNSDRIIVIYVTR